MFIRTSILSAVQVVVVFLRQTVQLGRTDGYSKLRHDKPFRRWARVYKTTARVTQLKMFHFYLTSVVALQRHTKNQHGRKSYDKTKTHDTEVMLNNMKTLRN